MELLVPAAPLLKRIKIATISVPNLDETTALYKTWLGYSAAEKGKISAAHATLWGAPAMTGRRYAVMRPASKTDVYIRAVEIDRVANYRALTTWGWGAVEIIADNPLKLHDKLGKSPFHIIGKPRFLNGYPTICAFQVRGPGHEVLYLTADTGNPGTGLLPKAGASVGRPFIMVLASGHAEKVRNWYCDTFKMKRNPINGNPVDIIQHAQALPPDHPFPLTVALMAEHGNLIEIDGYPAGTGPRPRNHGQLPPGVAMTSFGVKSLDTFKLNWLSQPAKLSGLGYESKRAACAVGPAGEIIELIEE
jgi:catechol 2,3-dioxygenase-like lactoylglutathione lyase family enzyme